MATIALPTTEGAELPDRATVREFAAALRGEVLRPGDAGYDQARKVWNGMIDRMPALILRCSGVSDVVRSVNFARDNNLALSMRGGGHNITGSAVAQGGLMLDMSRMKGIQVDPVRRIARAQAGVLWGELDSETQQFGLAVTGGQDSTTGIAGLTLGGGIGWLMRKCGLTIDNLLSVDMVLADGRFLTASASENSDLFWGVRGGGGNFGVVTQFEYRLHPVGPQVLAGTALYPGTEAAKVLLAFRELTEQAPDELTAMATFLHAPPAPFLPPQLHGTLMVGIGVCYAGPVEEGQRAIAPLRARLRPLVDGIQPVLYTAHQRVIEQNAPFGLHYYSKSHHLQALSDAAIDMLAAHGATMASPPTHIAVFHFGGAIARVPEGATAYACRESPYGLQIVSAWPPRAHGHADQYMKWARSLSDSMKPFAAASTYINMLGDEGQDRVREAYGAVAYERLVALKNKYDPTNLFRLNHNILPTVAPSRPQ